ncbi:MAG: hypothetical protein ACOYNC_18925, partial [Bacteroidales bacterium]
MIKLHATVLHLQKPFKNNISKRVLFISTGKPKAALTVFLFLVILFVSQKVLSQTYSAYQAGDQVSYGLNQWRGYVYDNNSYEPQYYFGYYDVSADFTTNWEGGAPGPFGTHYLGDSDWFAVRYMMQKTYENGLYTISANCDDGVKVYYNNTSGSTWTTAINDWTCTASTRTATNINFNGNYKIIFEYVECTGNAHAGISITQTCQMPGAPQNAAGTGTGLTTATLSWNVGSPAGTNPYYVYALYQASDNTMVGWWAYTQNLSANKTGLTANTGYYFTVYSYPDCWSNNTATVTSPVFYTGIIPGTPTSLSGTASGTATANLSWAAGSPAGNPAPTYAWEIKNIGGTTLTSGNTTGTSASVTGLTANTFYYFVVNASNNVGTSSSATSANFMTMPDPPTNVTATPPTIAVGNSASLNATSAGNTINWYTAATG